tara:strand:+ start:189 stop:884 length:696 start_codon:yes stop_codon:yes gene_type:complete
MHLLSYFPLAVFTHDLESELANEIEKVVEPHLGTLEKNDQQYSDFEGQEILEKVQAEPCIKGLITILMNASNKYISEIGLPDYPRGLNGWIQDYKNEKDHHGRHNHCDSVHDISGVYYIKGSENSSKLRIHNPNPIISLQNSSSSQTPYNNMYADMEIKKGKIYIFPSWLSHEVVGNKNNESGRTVFAFNLAQLVKQYPEMLPSISDISDNRTISSEEKNNRMNFKNAPFL